MTIKVNISQGITRTSSDFYEWVRIPDDNNGHDEYIRTRYITYYRNDTDDVIKECKYITSVNPYTLKPLYK